MTRIGGFITLLVIHKDFMIYFKKGGEYENNPINSESSICF